MVATDNIIRFLFQAVDNATSVSQRVVASFKMMGTQIVANQRNQQRFWDDYMKNVKGAVKMHDDMDDALKRNRGALMGIGFGMLFMGMAANRAIGGFLRSTFDAFKIVGTENSIFIQKTNELSAAWEFFKFSLVDALSNSTLFTNFIDMLVSILGWFGRLPEGARQFLIIGAAIAFVITWLASMAGQIGLLVLSFAALDVKIWGTLATKIASVTTAVKALTLALLKNPLFWLGFILASIIILMFQLREQTGGWGNAFKALGLTALLVINSIGEALVFLMRFALFPVIKLIDLLIAGWNALQRKTGGGNIIDFNASDMYDLAQLDFKARRINILSELSHLGETAAQTETTTQTDSNSQMQELLDLQRQQMELNQSTSQNDPTQLGREVGQGFLETVTSAQRSAGFIAPQS